MSSVPRTWFIAISFLFMDLTYTCLETHKLITQSDLFSEITSCAITDSVGLRHCRPLDYVYCRQLASRYSEAHFRPPPSNHCGHKSHDKLFLHLHLIWMRPLDCNYQIASLNPSLIVTRSVACHITPLRLFYYVITGSCGISHHTITSVSLQLTPVAVVFHITPLRLFPCRQHQELWYEGPW